MKRDVLVVVDMQNKFEACSNNYRNIKAKVKALVKTHQNRGDLVVVVEYCDSYDRTRVSHPTCPDILNEIVNGNYVKVVKQSDGGGHEVCDALRQNGGLDNLGRIYICGVNTCACVKSTAEQLAHHVESGKLKDNVVVLKDGTACYHDNYSNNKPYQEVCFTGYPVKYL